MRRYGRYNRGYGGVRFAEESMFIPDALAPHQDWVRQYKDAIKSVFEKVRTAEIECSAQEENCRVLKNILERKRDKINDVRYPKVVNTLDKFQKKMEKRMVVLAKIEEELRREQSEATTILSYMQ